MRVLFVTSEYAGLSKVGGLGEVSADLPRAMRVAGIDVRVMMPAYPDALARLRALGQKMVWRGPLGSVAGLPACRIGETLTPCGTPLYLIDSPELYDRPGTAYAASDGGDWPDNHLRFARLSLAAAEIAEGRGKLDWRPDLVHANDWPGGLTAAYLKWMGSDIPVLMTVHNIAYQGNFPAGLCDSLGIPGNAFAVDGVEFHGRISFLKAGLFYSDHVTTVSPCYAKEITTERFGCGMHGLLASRTEKGEVSGIANGIGESWNSATNASLPHHFDSSDLTGKHAISATVREMLCLEPSTGPIFGIVSRLVHQKGLDLVAACAEHIVDAGGQIAVLGMGDPEVEGMLSHLGRHSRKNIAVLIGFNEAMEHRILGGSDFCLMPSRYEPCGLTQMHAQRYGTLPIAHATGGLTDTVEDGLTGFLFSDFSPHGLREASDRAFRAFADRHLLDRMRRTAMQRDFSWSDAADQYGQLYRKLVISIRRAPRPEVGQTTRIRKEPAVRRERLKTMAA